MKEGAQLGLRVALLLAVHRMLLGSAFAGDLTILTHALLVTGGCGHDYDNQELILTQDITSLNGNGSSACGFSIRSAHVASRRPKP